MYIVLCTCTMYDVFALETARLSVHTRGVRTFVPEIVHLVLVPCTMYIVQVCMLSSTVGASTHFRYKVALQGSCYYVRVLRIYLYE